MYTIGVKHINRDTIIAMSDNISIVNLMILKDCNTCKESNNSTGYLETALVVGKAVLSTVGPYKCHSYHSNRLSVPLRVVDGCG